MKVDNSDDDECTAGVVRLQKMVANETSSTANESVRERVGGQTRHERCEGSAAGQASGVSSGGKNEPERKATTNRTWNKKVNRIRCWTTRKGEKRRERKRHMNRSGKGDTCKRGGGIKRERKRERIK